MAERLFRLEPVARNYAWGSPTAIPSLLGQVPTGELVAELWFGAHPDSPSTAPAGPLDRLIAADPDGLLGHDVAARFGAQLPFLLKILAADQALSIQVHPTIDQARAGYDDEQTRGIGLDDPARNYHDRNHKPELICALTEFDALCGFRPVAATVELLDALDVVALDPVRRALHGVDPLRAAFSLLLDWPVDDRAALIASVLQAAEPLADGGGPWATAARASLLAALDFPGDIGAVLALLLNAVRLQPGEAIYLGAGSVHAYLRGMGVEIMANSDNVLRCGLTAKHVDGPEVLRIADFTALDQPQVTARTEAGQRVFPVPVPDFELSVIEVSGPRSHGRAGPQILLVGDGVVTVEELELGAGQAVFVPSGQPVTLNGVGTIFGASVGPVPIS